MTIERWTDEKLDQLATDVQNNTIAISELRASTTELRISAEALLQTAVLHQKSLETSQRNFDTAARDFERIHAEITGLQLENRRMLEEMRSRHDDEPT